DGCDRRICGNSNGPAPASAGLGGRRASNISYCFRVGGRLGADQKIGSTVAFPWQVFKIVRLVSKSGTPGEVDEAGGLLCGRFSHSDDAWDVSRVPEDDGGGDGGICAGATGRRN